jgi:hypothetical protein
MDIMDINHGYYSFEVGTTSPLSPPATEMLQISREK